MDPSSIKNIFWDVDGVLADLNHAYYHFLTGHPNYRDQFKGLKWEQLPEVLPILPEYGALELKTHPELGTEMDRDFCADQAFFRDRPLYPRVIEVLKELNQLGYRQFTMSATFDVGAKTAFLRDILSPVTCRCCRGLRKKYRIPDWWGETWVRRRGATCRRQWFCIRRF